MSDDPDTAGRAPVTTVTLELDADADPIRGRLGEQGEPGETFVGWLGLARALERVLEAGARRSPS